MCYHFSISFLTLSLRLAVHQIGNCWVLKDHWPQRQYEADALHWSIKPLDSYFSRYMFSFETLADMQRLKALLWFCDSVIIPAESMRNVQYYWTPLLLQWFIKGRGHSPQSPCLEFFSPKLCTLYMHIKFSLDEMVSTVQMKLT